MLGTLQLLVSFLRPTAFYFKAAGSAFSQFSPRLGCALAHALEFHSTAVGPSLKPSWRPAASQCSLTSILQPIRWILTASNAASAHSMHWWSSTPLVILQI